jgi:hypothetical protein
MQQQQQPEQQQPEQQQQQQLFGTAAFHIVLQPLRTQKYPQYYWYAPLLGFSYTLCSLFAFLIDCSPLRQSHGVQCHAELEQCITLRSTKPL